MALFGQRSPAAGDVQPGQLHRPRVLEFGDQEDAMPGEGDLFDGHLIGAGTFDRDRAPDREAGAVHADRARDPGGEDDRVGAGRFVRRLERCAEAARAFVFGVGDGVGLRLGGGGEDRGAQRGHDRHASEKEPRPAVPGPGSPAPLRRLAPHHTVGHETRYRVQISLRGVAAPASGGR
jgi:hypothetical protein